MRRAGCIAVAWMGLVGLGCGQATEDDEALARGDHAILHGKFAVQDDILGTVALVDAHFGFAFCTGTLIAPDVVVTAAHCGLLIDPEQRTILGPREPDSFVVVAGVISLAEAEKDDVFAVADIDLHPDFAAEPPDDPVTSLGNWHDIAVVSLTRPVDSMVPVPLLASTEELSIGQELLIGGFGTADREGETGGGVLRKAFVPLVRLGRDEFIAGRSGTPDTCPGDSGGPVYLERGDSVALVGITSRALRDASTPCGEGGIYTLVSAHLEYLRATSPTPLASVGSHVQVGGASRHDADDEEQESEVIRPSPSVDAPEGPATGNLDDAYGGEVRAVRGGCAVGARGAVNGWGWAWALGVFARMARRRRFQPGSVLPG